jgi:hypothetical protein
MEKSSTETEKGHFCLEDDGIIHVTSLPGTDQTYGLADAKEFVAALTRLAGERRVPVLVKMKEVRQVDREARRYFAGEEPAKVTLAAALLVDSVISRVIGNFFLGYNKTLFPAKLFGTEHDAIDWLKGFVD